MSHLPELISDLAFILITAGITTIIFKRLGQPLVLGYIVAGFLAGPHMPYTPTVSDTGSIQTWADIGVIFLMFTLGLEFSFKKILRMGQRPIVAALLIIFFMLSIGSATGHLFGWGRMDSLFLGGMLAMSSTTIIYKAFDDLGLRTQKFAGEVLSVLIIEDILGIVLMVILSAMAVSRDFEGGQMLFSMLKLAFFLILWFIVGVYLVPTLLRKGGRWMNSETLVVVAVGLCFAMVVIASAVGYSSAFGAFMMGSILAETMEAESIERVVDPLKNLFGAIFFVSVGMLVDPDILVAYWQPIAVITLVIIAGQSLLGSAAFMLSGQPLKVAMQCGFSMAQIGEFAFIIASLGTTLGVTGSFLYPVVVAVSIITTFLTPYMIRAAAPAYQCLCRYLPGEPTRAQKRRSSKKAVTEHAPHTDWRELLSALTLQVGVYLTLSIAAIFLAFGALLPICRATMGSTIGGIVCGLLTLVMVSPFLRAVVMRKNHSEQWRHIATRGKSGRWALYLTFFLRWVISVAIAGYIIETVSPLTTSWRHLVHIAVGALCIIGIMASRGIKYVSIRMERTFRSNLSLRERQQNSKNSRPGYARRLQRHDMHMAKIVLPADTTWGGKTLQQLEIGRSGGVLIAAILRGSQHINIPGGSTPLFPGDKLEVLGDDDSLQALTKRIEADVVLEAGSADTRLELKRLHITEHSPLCGHSIKDSRLKEQYHCMAVGFEQEDGTIDLADSARNIHHGDTLWIIGEKENLKRLQGE
jgi:CPA2 family monovalent cation:H+ antiporter-2